MGNSILSGVSLDEIGKVEELIEESVNENNCYDDVIAMEKINKYFEKQKKYIK